MDTFVDMVFIISVAFLIHLQMVATNKSQGNNVPDGLSAVTDTESSTVAPHQTYASIPIKNKQGEKNSHWQHSNVVDRERVYLDERNCCETDDED